MTSQLVFEGNTQEKGQLDAIERGNIWAVY